MMMIVIVLTLIKLPGSQSCKYELDKFASFWQRIQQLESEHWEATHVLEVRNKNVVTEILYFKLFQFERKLMPPVKTIEELREIQTTYFSFMTVRHPFERILSAYRDKFFVLRDTPNEVNKAVKFYKLYGKRIIENYRSENDSSSQDAKWVELIQSSWFMRFHIYVVSTLSSSIYFNPFMPVGL